MTAQDFFASGASTAGTQIQFIAGSLTAGELRAASFRCVERMSRSFSLEVVVTTPGIDQPALDAAILGHPARLSVAVPEGSPRVFTGVVWSVQAESTVVMGIASSRIRIVPRLRLLEHRKGSRIFQDLPVGDVISRVLQEAKVPFALNLSNRYPTRSYCVQYDETDLEFITRLCAEEGIFYYFDFSAAAADLSGIAPEVVVFGDDARRYPRIAGSAELVYRASEGDEGLAAREDHVQHFSLRQSLRPSATLIRDYDFRRPLLEIARSAVASDPGAVDKSAAEGPERARDVDARTPRERMYRHQSDYYETQIDRDTAGVELEQYRRKVWVGRGTSLCRRLAAGHSFNLDGHPTNDLNQDYVITSVRHEGYAPEASREHRHLYENRFECAPVTSPFRPRRPRRRLQQVAETAIVVGPEGHDIHTDDLGRIKVQFHWDLEGKRNEHSSCWIRVSQAWAGPSFGFQFIPRVGMEVLVTFLGGDVDRPVVTGCLYNAINAPSQPLPSRVTRSGIRTHTTPGGGGFNELTFDDQAGQEQVLLRAQRRFDEVIVGDHSISIGGGESVKAGGSRQEEIGGDLTSRVGGRRSEEVAGNRGERIGGDFDRVVLGEQRTSVLGDASADVTGNHMLTVRGNHHVVVGHGKDEGHALLYVNGDYAVAASQELKLSAMKSIKLSVGDSVVEITPEGIKLKGASISVEGADGASFKVKEHELKMDEKLELVSDTIEIFSSKGSIVMDENVHIDGKLVKLNCKPKAPDPAKQQEKLPEEGIATFRVKRKADGSVPSGVTLMIATPSGEVIEREADAEGKVEVKGKKGERFILVGVRQGDHSFGHQKS